MKFLKYIFVFVLIFVMKQNFNELILFCLKYLFKIMLPFIVSVESTSIPEAITEISETTTPIPIFRSGVIIVFFIRYLINTKRGVNSFNNNNSSFLISSAKY